MSRPKNEHDDLKQPHTWSREHGYQVVEPEVNEAAAEDSPAAASELGDDPAKRAEAIEFVKQAGYSEEAAKIIVDREGVGLILQSKADKVAVQAERAKERVLQPQVQEITAVPEKPADGVTKEAIEGEKNARA